MGSASSSTGNTYGHYGAPGYYPRYNPYWWYRPRRRDPASLSVTTLNDDVDDVDPPTPAALPTDAKDLRFEGIDFNLAENRKTHHTHEYENKSLIVRRGFPIKLKVSLSDAYNKETDEIVLHFLTGTKPRISHGTRLRVSSNKEADWKMDVEVQEKDVILEVTADTYAAIGRYKIIVETRREQHGDTTQFHKKHLDDEMILLFNPYCKEDDVYLDDEEYRKEYVENDIGYIYMSGYYGKSWNYGQFEPNILECTLYLLENSYLSTTPRSFGNIVQVLRALSAMVNEHDDNGVLSGNWSGEYGGGTPPTQWSGSVKILQEYFKTKSPVKFGQCWVFAAVLNTVCRALGIPSRPVTNGSSAHDSDGSCTIDKYIDANGDLIKGKGDSVWNFHVWNEAWCRRPDLPSPYTDANWQAFDSTPQERSDHIMRTGPCPVAAIKKGDVHIPFDAAFIFAEVNADTLWWKKKGNGDLELMKIDTRNVGDGVSTKVRGDKNWREDLSSAYKDREGSKEEREAVLNAVRDSQGDRRDGYKRWKLYMKDKELTLNIRLKGEILENEDCRFTLKVENKDDTKRDITAALTMSTKYTDGQIGATLASFEKKYTIGPKQEENMTWEVPAEDYFSKMDDEAWLFVWARARVDGTGELITKSDEYYPTKPEIKISMASEEVKVGGEFDVTLDFINPTSVKLTNCKMDVEGPGILKTKDIKIDKTLDSNASLTATVRMKARVPGKRQVIASFDSKELRGISGSSIIAITE